MQATEISKDLSYAIETVEEVLNSKDGNAFLNAIRKFKQTKEIDNSDLLRLKKYLR